MARSRGRGNLSFRDHMLVFAETQSLSLDEESTATIPKRWEIFDDLVLLPANSFRTEAWRNLEPRLWNQVAGFFRVARVARHGAIQPDDFRSPQLEMLLGTATWVRKRDNGIVYELDLSKSMFSSGNITEKIRMSELAVEGETIFDLFAGIGYFTIPLLKAGAAKMIASEWNPAAVIALRRNLNLNKVSDRCEVRFGDNRKVAPVGVADRVLLGLIPTSEASWSTACKALRQDVGGFLHVHMNVETFDKKDCVASQPVLGERCTIAESVRFRSAHFQRCAIFLLNKLVELSELDNSAEWSAHLLHLEVVKSYGPKVFHCVFDVHLQPVRNVVQ